MAADFYMATGNLPVRKSVLSRPEIVEFHKKNPNYERMIGQLAFLEGRLLHDQERARRLQPDERLHHADHPEGRRRQEDPDEANKNFQDEIDELKATGSFLRLSKRRKLSAAADARS